MLLANRNKVTNAGLGVYRETPLQLPYSDSDQQQQQQQQLQQHSDAGLAVAAAQFGRGASAGHTANTNASGTGSGSSATGGAATLDPTTAASLLQQLALRRAQSSSPPKTV
jgi:hypothetical protein